MGEPSESEPPALVVEPPSPEQHDHPVLGYIQARCTICLRPNMMCVPIRPDLPGTQLFECL
eukprot:9464300-Alexandrium_andersonii.AAC.1